VDEVNRAQPKTQSVFLEAMEEKNITLANTIHTLPVPFFLIATQNPIEYDGTYPLPEAQQDRFLMKLNMTYLSVDDEKALMMRKRPSQTCKIMGRQEVAAAQHYAKYSVTADEGVVDHIVSIVSETRRRREALIGASTRCSLQYLQAAKAKAMLEGRDEVSPKDVTDLAHPILRHRIVMNQDCKSFGYSPDDLIDDILRKNKK
jgi:MoxR-like ATPase